MRRFVFVVLLLSAVATALPAAASEAVIRGGTISFPRSDNDTPAYSGSSAPPAARTTILRGMHSSVVPAPAYNLGGDTDGPILNPACLHTEPPSCR